MAILSQFLFQLSFGLSLTMAVTPARLVTSGFYRVHLLVVMGLMTLASFVAMAEGEATSVWPPALAATLSYLGSVVWLYEKPRLGVVFLLLVSALSLLGGFLSGPFLLDPAQTPTAALIMRWLTVPCGGLILGTTMGAMLLGHWYLNTPTMELAPLRRLVLLMGLSTLLRIALSGVAAGFELSAASNLPLGGLFWPLLSLRWLAGLLGVLVLAWMAWQTLKVPNTQSATGILYVGVIGTFVGELASALLSAEAVFPL